MKNLCKPLFTLMALALSVAASAQIQSTYFLDNYSYSYRHNPANMSEQSFFGLGISNMEVGVGSTVGLSNFLYPAPGGDGLVTGFNSSISSEEFLKGIEDSNAFLGNLDLNILSVGIRKGNAMTTVELNSRTLMDASIDGDLGPISSDLIPVNSFNCKLNLGLVLRFGKNSI